MAARRVSFEGYHAGGGSSGGAPSPVGSLVGEAGVVGGGYHHHHEQHQQQQQHDKPQHWAAGLVGPVIPREEEMGQHLHAPAPLVEVGPYLEPEAPQQRPQARRPGAASPASHHYERGGSYAHQQQPPHPQTRPSLYSTAERRHFPLHRPPVTRAAGAVPHLSGLEAGRTPVQYPFQPPPSLAQHAYARTARGLSERAADGEGRRWNPILGGFVRAATAEADIAAEVQHQDMSNFQSGMARLMAREGEYDPIFWRHRVTKEEAALPPRTQGPKLLAHARTDSIKATLRMSDNQAQYAAEMEAARAGGLRSELAGMYSKERHMVDHVRALLDPEDTLAVPVPPEEDGNRHRPVANREFPWGADHVKALIRGDNPPEQAMLEEHGRPSRKANAAFHYTQRAPTDFCVANLISEDKARRLPLPPAPLSPYKRTPLGDRMRSGDDVRVILHPHTDGKPLERCPYDATSYLPHGQQQAPHAPPDRNPFRRPQFLERTQWADHQLQAQQRQQKTPSPALSSSSNPPQPIARDPLPPPSAAMAALTLQGQPSHRRDSLLSADEHLAESAFVVAAGGNSSPPGSVAGSYVG